MELALSLRETIIKESLRLFSLKGFLSTSIDDILKASHTSKGGFYNHFASKEYLFFQVLDEAQAIWRERVLFGLDEISSPLAKIRQLLLNYKDRYLKDGDSFPGGCVFITLSVELDDQRPHLSREVDRGFQGLRRMIEKLLDEAVKLGELRSSVSPAAIAGMILESMLGASVAFGVGKSHASLDGSINTLIDFLEELKLPDGRSGMTVEYPADRRQ